MVNWNGAALKISITKTCTFIGNLVTRKKEKLRNEVRCLRVASLFVLVVMALAYQKSLYLMIGRVGEDKTFGVEAFRTNLKMPSFLFNKFAGFVGR